MSHTTFAQDRSIRIIGVASGLGAKDERCETGPLVLRESDLVAHLRARHARAKWSDMLHPLVRSDDDVVETVADVCRRLAQRVEGVAARGALPVVLGGDHSCAIGTWKGAARALAPQGPLGLIWIDAHMDAHTPQTTPSGMVHGMPLACLLGQGDSRLTSLADGIALRPQDVCLIGIRSFERGEADLLRELGVRIYFMDEVAKRGIGAVLQEALTTIAATTAGFGITLDLDALDPDDAPGVGSPVAGGIRSAELATALAGIASHPALAAIEIVEYNPACDQDQRTAGQVVRLLDAMLTEPRARERLTRPVVITREQKRSRPCGQRLPILKPVRATPRDGRRQEPKHRGAG